MLSELFLCSLKKWKKETNPVCSLCDHSTGSSKLQNRNQISDDQKGQMVGMG